MRPRQKIWASVWATSWCGMRRAARSALAWPTSGGQMERATGVNSQFVLSPGALDGFATAYFGAVRVKPGGVGPLQKRVFESYPTVTVVNAQTFSTSFRA